MLLRNFNKNIEIAQNNTINKLKVRIYENEMNFAYITIKKQSDLAMEILLAIPS